MQSVACLMTYAALGSGALAGLMYFTGLTGRLSVTAAIVLAPVFYLAWLTLFLGWGYVIGLPFYAWIHCRPGRVSTREGGAQARAFERQMVLHLKFRMVQSLPMAGALQGLPFWRQLVCRGYASQNKISRNTHVFL